MKPDDLIKCSISPVVLNNRFIITCLEIDLRHINHGLDDVKSYRDKARSQLRVEDVIICFQSLNGSYIIPKKSGPWLYFMADRTFFSDMRMFRIIFCINTKETGTAGIITLFRMRG